MKAKVLALVFILGQSGLLSVPDSRAQAPHAQVTKGRLDAAGTKLQAARSFYDKLSPQQRNMLSGSALNFFHVVEHWPELERRALAIENLSGSSRLPDALASAQLSQTDVPTTAGPVRVSDPSTDFKYGPSGGFTHSETSTAWCGKHVVVGFNDSGDIWDSGFATGFTALSFSGFATSTATGTAYTDEGFLPSGVRGNSFSFLEGDPVLVCTSASNFFYSSLLSTVTGGGAPLSAISVSQSTNGGSSFHPLVIAVSKDANTHLLDKDWMAVNPANPSQIAVTYTDFDFSSTNGCGSGIERSGIELVFSTNGGASWSSPIAIAQTCVAAPNFPFLQSSQVAFSPSGAVNVGFEFFPSEVSFVGEPGGREILFTQAPSLGGAFGGLVTVASGITGIGDGFELQGGFRRFSGDFQAMAVDRSGTSTNGNIYIVWHGSDSADSEHNFNGVGYRYSDAWISTSTNNGANWSTPVQVNTNTEPLSNGLGTDSYMPGVAVDNTSGKVGVCWYDRRNDPLNYKFDRFCGESSDAGASFTNFQITMASSQPIHGTDDLFGPFYMGDYDSVASDTLKTTSGFVGAFQIIAAQGGTILVPAPDVWAINFN